MAIGGWWWGILNVCWCCKFGRRVNCVDSRSPIGAGDMLRGNDEYECQYPLRMPWWKAISRM